MKLEHLNSLEKSIELQTSLLLEGVETTVFTLIDKAMFKHTEVDGYEVCVSLFGEKHHSVFIYIGEDVDDKIIMDIENVNREILKIFKKHLYLYLLHKGELSDGEFLCIKRTKPTKQ